jgi:AcrR family transcriptional regulator
VEKTERRGGRPPSGKSDERRTQLAESVLTTLGELGYARTSLRSIAENSSFSHGVVHYYFRDKSELITHGVRLYKTQCATRYDEIVETATTPEEFGERFLAKLGETLVQDASMHRLWYDVRNQSQFEEALRADVSEIDRLLEAMIWRVLSRYSVLLGRDPGSDSATAYACFDGLFQQALLAHLNGDPQAVDDLRRRVSDLLGILLRP